MKSLTSTILKRALVSGSYASLISTGALLHGGARDGRSAVEPINAVSHWLWKERAIHQHKTSARYSAVGYLIHHAASIFWAIGYEALAARRTQPATPAQTALDAASVAAVACVVDLTCAPERLTPGFERHLGSRTLLGVYTAFAIGLALHDVLGSRKRRR